MLWSWSRLSSFDRSLIAGSAAILVVAVGLIFQDVWIYRFIGDDTESLDIIGSTKAVNNDVRRRHRTALSWAPLSAKDAVFQGDSVFTGSGSNAVIVTESGEEISISPNSLVVINTKQDSIRLDINYGSILGKLGKEKKLVIAKGDGVTEFSGSEALLKVNVENGRDLVVDVIEGEVQVGSGINQRRLGPRETAALGQFGDLLDFSDLKIDLQSPEPNRTFGPNDSDGLIFSWRSNFKFESYQVEVATDSDFKDIILKESSSRQAMKPSTLPSNRKLFWRVRAVGRQGSAPTVSDVGSFRLVEDVPPKVKFPADKQIIYFERQAAYPQEDKIDLVLAWQPTAASQSWEVQLSKQPDFGIAKNEKVADTTGLSVLGLGPGIYYWRVRATDWATSQWSDTAIFRIYERVPAGLEPPKVVVADQDFLLRTRSNPSLHELSGEIGEDLSQFATELPQLSWNEVQGAIGYELEISQRPDFDVVILEDRTTTPEYIWKSVRLGRFYWRARSLTASGRRGPFTAPSPLTVKLAPPESQSPTSVVENVENLALMESAPPPFTLLWSPTLFTAQYAIEFDKGPDFTKPLRLTVTRPFKRIQAPAAGTYYWRVQSLGPLGEPLSDWSPAQVFSYTKNYLSPETSGELKALHPNNDTIMVIGQGDLRVHFRWSSPLEDTTYRIQLSKSEQFNTVQLDLKTDKRQYLHEDRLADGWYFWRIRIESSTFTSPWTKAFKFQVRNEDQMFSFKESERKLEEYYQILRKEKAAAARKAALESSAEARRQIAYEALPQLSAPIDLTSSEIYTLEPLRPQRSEEKPWRSLPEKHLSNLIKNPPTLSWNPTSMASEYEIEISPDNQFNQITEKGTANKPSFSWLSARPGTFYWRVRATKSGHRPSEFVIGDSFTVFLRKTTIRSAIVAPVSSEAPKPRLRIEWEPMLFVQRYLVEWSRDLEFKNPARIIVDQESATLSPRLKDTIFVRVTGLNQNDSPVSESSTPHPLSILPFKKSQLNPARPQPIFPPDKAKVVTLEDSNTKIAFIWHTPSKSDYQILEVSSDKDFKTLVARRKTLSSSAKLDLPISEGTVYWRIRAVRDPFSRLPAAKAKKQKVENVTSDISQLDLVRRVAGEPSRKK